VIYNKPIFIYHLIPSLGLQRCDVHGVLTVVVPVMSDCRETESRARRIAKKAQNGNCEVLVILNNVLARTL